MFLHFDVNSLKDVRVNIFAINVSGKVGFRATIHDSFNIGEPNEKSQNYEIYDNSSLPNLARLVFDKYVGVSRGSKNIVATIKTDPPGRLQFIKEKKHLAECYPLSTAEIQQLSQELKSIFGIK